MWRLWNQLLSALGSVYLSVANDILLWDPEFSHNDAYKILVETPHSKMIIYEKSLKNEEIQNLNMCFFLVCHAFH